MSDVTMITNLIPEKRQPWKRPAQTFRQLVVLALVAGVLATIAVRVTGLAGFLGWYIAFVAALLVTVGATAVTTGAKLAFDRLATVLVSVLFSLVALPWISLIYTVISRGAKAVYLGFFTTDMFVNSSDDPLNQGGISHAIVGTLLMVLVASLIAVPLGIVAAIYIVEIKGRFAGMVRFFTQAMSGVPSIVAGLFIYSTVVMTLTHKFNGIAGALSLSILMLPTVARTTEEVLKVVPRELRDASYALGASQFKTTFKIVLPTARSGLITAAVLGVARVAGETAPLLLTSQYFVKFTTDMFNNPMASLPTYVFGNLLTGTDNSYARAWAASMVLISIVVVLSVTARLIGGRNSGKK